MRRTLLSAIFLLTVPALSCGEPPRENRVERIADAACDRFDECGSLENDYESYGECVSDMESRFYDLWPEDRCGEDRINKEKYRECLDRAHDYPCDASGLDLLSFLDRCNASKVCID